MVHETEPKARCFTLFVLLAANSLNGLFISIQTPPYLRQMTLVENSTLVMIWCTFIKCISALLFGVQMNFIGRRLVLQFGMMTIATCSILFGLLSSICEPEVISAVIPAVNVVQAAGNAAFVSSTLATIAVEFPDKLTASFATVLASIGYGYVFGEGTDGASRADQATAFVVIGIAFYFLAWLILLADTPSDDETVAQDAKPESLMDIMKSVAVHVHMVIIFATGLSSGFVATFFKQHPDKVVRGTTLAFEFASFAITAQLHSWMLCEKLACTVSLSVLGFCFMTVAMWLIAWASHQPLELVWYLYPMAQCWHGTGVAAQMVGSFICVFSLPGINGKSKGMISAIGVAVFELGCFIGYFLEQKIGSACTVVLFYLVLYLAISGYLMQVIREKRRRKNYSRNLLLSCIDERINPQLARC